jgi:KDO2-lipid IV(A) lauroyltransferase
MLELLKLPYLTAQQIHDLVHARGLEHLQEAQARGQGVILVTAHYGNWELMAAMLADRGLPITVIARDSQEPFTASLINRARASHGIVVLERDDARAMLRALRANCVLGILPDQHAADNAIIVDFLGRPAATAVGVATLAARTGAPVVPSFCRRRPDGTFEALFYPPLPLVQSGDREADVRTNTILVNQALEEQIRAHPEQWLWLHRRWKVDPAVTASPQGVRDGRATSR